MAAGDRRVPGCGAAGQEPARGDPQALTEGQRLWNWYNCSGCHSAGAGGGMGPSPLDAHWIYGSDDACRVSTATSSPGVRESRGRLGPPLDRFARRSFVGGRVANTPANLVAWIRDAPAFDPHVAMPDTNISEQDARDIAAYLYTLR